MLQVELRDLLIAPLIVPDILLVFEICSRAHPPVERAWVRLNVARFARLGEDLLVLRHNILGLTRGREADVRRRERLSVFGVQSPISFA